MAPYQTAISAIIEVLEGIQHDLVKLGYDGPMVYRILFSMQSKFTS
jgi:hypothetical protein